MITSAAKIAIVTTALLLFLYLVKIIGKKHNLHPEWQRKLIHSGMGFVTLTFPLIFSSIWEISALFCVIIAIFLAMRMIPALKKSLGQGLHGVERKSGGEILFALAVFLLFAFYKGNFFLYAIPILILSLCDAAAALVGVRFGKRIFQVHDGKKSWEGTITFLLLTFVLSFSILWAGSSLSAINIVLIAMILAILGALTEAISWHGMDNLFIPVMIFLLLDAFITDSTLRLAWVIFFLCTSSAIIYYLARFSTLNTHALLGAVLSGFFFREVGGWPWLLAPFMLFVVHIILANLQSEDHQYRFGAVLSITSSGILWIFIDKVTNVPEALYLFTLSMAIHLQIIILLRIKAQRGKESEIWLVSAASILSGWLLMPTLFLFYGVNDKIIVLFISGLVIMTAGGVLTGIKTDRISNTRWTHESLLAISGSLIGYIPIWIMQ